MAQRPPLPRDTRDTLFMLAVIAWVLLPLVQQLPLWGSALAALVIVWRGWLAWRGLPLPGTPWRIALLALAVGATLLSFKTLLGRDAGVTLVAMLLALKTLELRARRDAFVVFFLSFFLMLTNFFYSQSLGVAAAMLIALLGLLTALVNAHLPVGQPPLWVSARTAAGMTLLGAPIMVLLFVLFPRVAPLWGLPADAMSGRSGLSASMTVGNIASLALDDSVAMRVQFEGPVPDQVDLYFRGPVLGSFDGRRWTPTEGVAVLRSADAQLQVQGAGVRYQITLEPNQQPWLLTLDATAQPPQLPQGQPRMSSELTWLRSAPVTELLRFSATSHPQFSHGPRQFTAQLAPYLALPAGYNPRTQALAREWLQAVPPGSPKGKVLAQRALDLLRTGGFVYTLEPGLFGRDSADEFWFERKQGFCEHIAASFVVLMRAAGVPARVVTGYQGGAVNPVDGYWTVRQSDAHAWAEVWLQGTGWVRVDPTGAVAPARTGSFTRLAAPRGALANAIFGSVSPAVALTLRAAWEAVNNRWNQWVLSYSQSRQLDLLKALGFSTPSWQDLVYLLCGLVVTLSLAGAGWSAWERQRVDPWLRLLAQAAGQLARAGVPITRNATPRQLAETVQRRGAAGLALSPVVAQPPSTLWEKFWVRAVRVGAQETLQKPPHHDAAWANQWAGWLLRLEELRYAAGVAGGRSEFRRALATLRRELKRLR